MATSETITAVPKGDCGSTGGGWKWPVGRPVLTAARQPLDGTAQPPLGWAARRHGRGAAAGGRRTWSGKRRRTAATRRGSPRPPFEKPHG